MYRYMYLYLYIYRYIYNIPADPYIFKFHVDRWALWLTAEVLKLRHGRGCGWVETICYPLVNHRKTIGKPLGKMVVEWDLMMVYSLVNVYITMENHHAINGKTRYFDWAIFTSYFDITRGVP